MKNATREILMVASGLEAGEQQRIRCPFCQGGSGNEVSMLVSIGDSGAVSWHCFRNSCQASGSRQNGGRLVRTSSGRRPTKVRPFRGALRRLGRDEKEFLLRTICWTERHVEKAQALYTDDKDRYVFPILDPMGRRRGYVLRSWKVTDARDKALTRMDVEEPHMSYYHCDPSVPVIVVEDIPSAVRASMYLNAVSLNGTGCSADYANEIAGHFRRVVWALDNDATQQAVKLMRRHSLLFDESRLLPLERDLKDMGEDALERLLGGIR